MSADAALPPPTPPYSPSGARIRLVSTADAERIAAIYAPVVRETAISFELKPPSPDEVARRIAALRALERPWLVLERGGEVVGYAYGGRYRERPAYAWAVESSLCVAAEARGAGVGRALYDALLRVLTLQGFRRVYAAIALPNDASVALHRTAGFEPVGTFREAGYKLGAWRDVQWWQRGLDASPGTPTDPCSLAALVAMPAWSEAAAMAAALTQR